MEFTSSPSPVVGSPVVGVVDIAEARKERIKARREAIVWLLQNPDIPGDDSVNASTGEVSLDEQGVAYFRKGLALFGVTELDPGEPAAFDRLMATWGTLLSVGGELLSRDAFGDAAQASLRTIWHPDYVAYIDALWGGDDASVRKGARALGIHAGVSKRTAMLWRGPASPA
jgi:hypothetical protein